MSNENAELIRRAYQAYAKGDLDPMLELVDPATVGRAPPSRYSIGPPIERVIPIVRKPCVIGGTGSGGDRTDLGCADTSRAVRTERTG
jgi:hypothetical protein